MLFFQQPATSNCGFAALWNIKHIDQAIEGTIAYSSDKFYFGKDPENMIMTNLLVLIDATSD